MPIPRSQCQCRCHNPRDWMGEQVVHCAPCCEPDGTHISPVHPTISREHIASISNKLKDWWERTLDQKSLTPEQTGQLLRDLGFGLNDCLTYIEQQETAKEREKP